MDSNCTHKNLLVRDGTSRSARYPRALKLDYARVDERSLIDLLGFIKKFAGEINYFNNKNIPEGSFEDFFQDNVVSILSAISGFDTKEVMKSFNEAGQKIETGAQVKIQLKNQFDLIFTLLYLIETWFRKINEGLKVYNDFANEISANLSFELKQMIGYYKKAVDINLISESAFDNGFSYHIIISNAILAEYGFQQIWQRHKNPVTRKPYDEWIEYYNSIPFGTVYNPTGTLKERGTYTVYFLNRSLDKIISSFNRLNNKLDYFLEDALTNYKKHGPHFGLLLSFLQLFKYAQDEQNKLPGKHLDFYLHDVLELKKEEPVPDRVYIIFELAKNINKHKVDKGTYFKAGKDNLGKEILFKATEETIINKAVISSVQNIFIDKDHHYAVYASPMANSSDGMGGEFEEEPGSWKPFGESQHGKTIATMSGAKTGFLITSETLLMSEGKRSVNLDIDCSLNISSVPNDIEESKLTVYISAEEGWIERNPVIKKVASTDKTVSNDLVQIANNNIYISLLLDIDQPPVVALDPKLHDTRFSSDNPGIYIECKHGDGNFILGYLKSVSVNKITIGVEVENAANVIIQNDLVALDSAKPFQPFGPRPYVGSSFILGSPEIFNKKIRELTLGGIWCEFPKTAGIESHYSGYEKGPDHEDFTVGLFLLQNGNWTPLEGATSEPLFTGDNDDTLGLTFFKGDESDISDYIEITDAEKDVSKFTSKSKGGFVKMELADNGGFAFGHEVFPREYAKKALSETLQAMQPVDPEYVFEFPRKPYTPSIKDFKITYKAVGLVDFSSASTNQYNNNDGRFFQVHPFGTMEIHPSISNDYLTLFPEFSHIDPVKGKLFHNGQLILGISGLEPPASINMLFKMLEGSEDPELDTKEITWSYLENNEWKTFTNQEILTDNTSNLTSTGIVSLAIPSNCTLDHDILPGNTLYIMAAVDNNTNAAAKIIEITPQVVLVEFENNNNDPERLASPLEAGTIAKLKTKDASVKSVDQPYASFGGQTSEKHEDFYLRTAERLRHKDRGISIWDQERLILQKFQDLYKVKCINHTSYGFYETLGTEMDSEFAPGYVTLIVIPKTYNINAINPYEPRVTKARLADIEKYIRSKVSPFIQDTLKVLNPLYELLQLEFEVAFHPRYTDWGFYAQQLNTDIKKFLSPWAFEEGRDIMIGGRIHKSTLIDFVEEQYYVDYIKDFKVHRYINDERVDNDLDTIVPTTARSAFSTINTGKPEDEHIIKEIS